MVLGGHQGWSLILGMHACNLLSSEHLVNGSDCFLGNALFSGKITQNRYLHVFFIEKSFSSNLFYGRVQCTYGLYMSFLVC